MNRWMNRDLLLAHQFPPGIKGLVLSAFFGMAVLGMGSPALAGSDVADAEPVPAEAPDSAEVVSPKAEDENKKDAKDEGSEKGKKDEKPKKTLEEMVADYELIEGFFNLYRDPENGSMFMAVRADQLDREFIYFSYAENGVVAARAFRGAYRDQAILKFRKYFDRLEIIEENTNFYFDPDNAMARASDANISPAVKASLSIEATSEDESAYLIKMDTVFLTEALQSIAPNANPKKKPYEQFSLGKLSKDKSSYRSVRGYPENVNILVDYVYNNQKPYVRGGAEVTDPRYVTLTFQHSFIQMPDNNYQPRIDDARVGYFFDQVTDLTSDSVVPYRDLINRWNLEKRYPDRAKSKPIQPITWWIENTTPKAYRKAIKEGVLAWNEAFEAAGFIDAIEVKIQPDDAEWDAGDVRYNVLRWTSSPNPPFGGYGPSFTNPRTGQILGADIMLENVFVSNRVRYSRLFDVAASDLDGEAWEDESPLDGELGKSHCAFGASLRDQVSFAATAMAVIGRGSDVTRMVDEGLRELALHEVGHTLGLSHNMRASQLRSPDEIHNPDVTQGVLIGSVMDYAPTNLAPKGTPQGDFYTTRPGPYDTWAVQFGYQENMVGSVREAHLARSAEPALAFGNDADDMRGAGRGIDPRVMVDDMSSDAMAYAKSRFELISDVQGELLSRYSEDGDTWAELRSAYLVLMRQMQRQARVVSRYVGGIYVNRAVAGTSDVPPYVPVSAVDQASAMQMLADYVFSPQVDMIDQTLLQHLAAQRRGFAFRGRTEDPKLHQRVLGIQQDVLNHLLHPRVLQRLSDTGLYGNEYGLSEMMADLTASIFSDDADPRLASFRQPLQVAYVERLLKVIGPKGKNPFDRNARAVAYAEIKGIEERLEGMSESAPTAEARATSQYIQFLIDSALDA
ncbi:MAG: zinc-dependent metalloprotease [Gammaproteobacteria bacterium]